MTNHWKSGINRLNATIHIIGGSIGRLLATITVVFVISVLFAMITTKLPNTKGVIEFQISIDSIDSCSIGDVAICINYD